MHERPRYHAGDRKYGEQRGLSVLDPAPVRSGAGLGIESPGLCDGYSLDYRRNADGSIDVAIEEAASWESIRCHANRIHALNLSTLHIKAVLYSNVVHPTVSKGLHSINEDVGIE